jgi:hypothetical protein
MRCSTVNHIERCLPNEDFCGEAISTGCGVSSEGKAGFLSDSVSIWFLRKIIYLVPN